ncbi:maltotransferase domain-containing protein [Acidisoma sp. 7E03]
MTVQADLAPFPSSQVSPARSDSAPRPRIYMIHPLLAGPLAGWGRLFDRAASLGFTHVLTAPPFAGPSLHLVSDFGHLNEALEWQRTAEEGLAHLAEEARSRDLGLLLDVSPGAVAAGGAVMQQAPALFSPSLAGQSLDPRAYGPEADAATANWAEAAEALAAFWADHLAAWRSLGLAGFRIDLLGVTDAARPSFLRDLRGASDGLLLGWTPGLAREAMAALAGSGLDFVFSSLPWWDFRSEWLWEEMAVLETVAPVIAPVEAPFGLRLATAVGDLTLLPAAQKRALGFAAAAADGLLMPMGFENGETRPWDRRRGAVQDMPVVPAGLTASIQAANRSEARGTLRLLSGPDAPSLAFLRTETDLRQAETARLTLLNPSLRRRMQVALGPLLAAAGGRFQAEDADALTQVSLEAGALRTMTLSAMPPVILERPALASTARVAAETSRRVAIEAVTPAVDGGAFPVKRLAGETVTVEADILCDGHDKLGAVLLWRRKGKDGWAETRMRLVTNDRWQAEFPLPGIGVYEFAVEAWRDAFASYRDELTKKHQAGLDLKVELMEGRALLAGAGRDLADSLVRFDGLDTEGQVALLLSNDTTSRMAAADPRPFAVRSTIFPVDADRLESRFASWYEIFPRSMSDDANRHGTFRDVERHLPRIRDMGFNVLYFPPIHPIGRTNRKGRNNTLTPAETDPGSPYAIGSDAGGHDAVHPELGTLEDFRHLVAAAAQHGLEIALDFAIQCAPDHPWLKEHPGWFDWRPDGSIKYAENPPKKYQDIVNVDFYAKDAVPDLWVELARVVLFWCDQGVRIFRVDNPHTKPFPFWEWMIAEVRARFPGTQFLAEAFTRPKIMNRLGKIGFSQSYTYFTWRNARWELEEYMTTLTQGPEADFFRPNFFVNTPDINPVFLQNSGRPGHLIRACLAATLSGLWGVYSGFELCEATPLPGREEYKDSEKYQLRAWDWDRPGNIVAEITLLNRIRRQNPALQSHLGIRFLPSDNEQVIIYERFTPDRSNCVIVAVNLDPYHYQESNTELPFYAWGVPDHGTLAAADLVPGRRIQWQSKWQRFTLDPSFPFAIWRVEPETV